MGCCNGMPVGAAGINWAVLNQGTKKPKDAPSFGIPVMLISGSPAGEGNELRDEADGLQFMP